MDYSMFIKIYDIIHKEPVTCAIDKETKAEDIVIDLCQKFDIKPVARHLFSLCSHSSQEWVSPTINLFKTKDTSYDFRLRFKLSDFGKLRIIDNEAYNFYFHQVRNDVLNNKVPEISCEKNKKELLGMGVADMLRVRLETGVSVEAVQSDYKKFIPKEVYRRHMFFAKQPMRDALNSLEKCATQEKYEPWFVKYQYLKQFEDLAPSYLCEEYKAVVIEPVEGGLGLHEFRVNIHVNPYDQQLPGIKMRKDGLKEWQHVCSIEDLVFITVRADANMEISRKSGIPVHFKFSSILNMFSLVSLLDGYYRLGVKWTFSLCKDLPTPSLERLSAIKSHGPIGGEFSYGKLERMRSNKPGCYILRESELAYDQYYLDVCIENSTKPITYKIERHIGKGYSFNGEDKCYLTMKELMTALKSPESPVKLVECLPPSEYDISPILLCKVEKEDYDEEDDGKSPGLPAVPHFIDAKELQLFRGKTKELKGTMSTVYHGVWRRKKRRKVDIAFKVFQSDKHNVEEQLEMMGKWASAQTPSLVRLFGISLNSPLGMVMELLPRGPLDCYLRHNSKRVKEVDLVEAANYLATALWNLEEAGMVHGNIRCHKLLVADHTESSFVVKLSDPGMTRECKPHEIHWLAPECYHLRQTLDNSYKTTASDMWAFGTTLWEIFSKGHKPNVHEQDLKAYYMSGQRLTPPKGCSVDLYRLMQQCWTLDPQRRRKTQEALRDINYLLYQVFNTRRMHSYETVDLSGEGKISRANSIVSFDFSTERTTITSNLSTDSERSRDLHKNKVWSNFSDWFGSKNDHNGVEEIDLQESVDVSTWLLNHDISTATTSLNSVTSLQCMFEVDASFNVVLQGRIGVGNYGEVYRAYLERSDFKDDETLGLQVAVKKLRTDKFNPTRQDFEREIQIMKDLQHENIVKTVAVIRDPEINLVMEYIPHGSLQCYITINKDRLKPENLLKFALDIAKGMDYLGEKNIVHRDLAARNILVASDSHVKISDFGLAQYMETESNYYMLKTSRELPIKWYAPESLISGKFSQRSDMWSYGVTLFEMFSLGEDPQLPTLPDKCTDQTLMLAALDKGVRLPCPPSCPQHIYVTIIHPCWHYDSHLRPSFQDMARTVEQLRATYLNASS